jgi:lipopolysaccharide export system permease protein
VLKIIDWYIIRKFVSTYLFAILALTVIIIVFDTSEKIDDFVAKQVPLTAIIFNYYGNLIPYLLSVFSALFTFIAVIFFTSNLASHTEIVAMLSNGISFSRIMRPYMITAVAITIFNCILVNFVIPPATANRYEFEEKYIRNPYQNRERDIHRQCSPTQFLYMESFGVREQTAYRFSLENIENDELQSKLTSAYATWDSSKNVWCVYNYTIRTLTDSGEVIAMGQQLDTSVYLTGKDFSIRLNRFVETMNFFELNEYIGALEHQGAAAINDALIEKHKRFAYPVASIILTVIGVTLSSRKMRGGMGIHIGLGVGLSFSYILFQRFSEMFVQSGTLTPGVALWVPNILYIGVAMYLYRNTPK